MANAVLWCKEGKPLLPKVFQPLRECMEQVWCASIGMYLPTPMASLCPNGKNQELLFSLVNTGQVGPSRMYNLCCNIRRDSHLARGAQILGNPSSY